MTTPHLRDEIARDESCRLTAYPDPLRGWRVPTIGYGHTGPGVREGLVWTQSEADRALDADLAGVERTLDSGLAWWRGLDDLRQDAVVNLAFNLGFHGLLRLSRFLTLLKAGSWSEAADDLAGSLWARQVGQRAQRVVGVVRTGARQAIESAT